MFRFLIIVLNSQIISHIYPRHIKTHIRHHNVQKLYVNYAGLLLESLRVKVVMNDLIHDSVLVLQHAYKKFTPKLTWVIANNFSILFGEKVSIMGIKVLYFVRPRAGIS